MVIFLFLLHRYLGIALGLIISLWCLSGFVMMYVQFPDLTNEDQLQGLNDLDLSSCCVLPNDFSDIPIDRFRVEMMAERPVLRLSSGLYQYIIDITNGEYLTNIDEETGYAVAGAFANNMGISGTIKLLGTIDHDQWTIYGGLNPNRPLLHYRSTDNSATEWYISRINGEVIQMTTARERFWNWAGSVVHWIYPTILRQHTGAWTQVIIGLSVLGLFLTVIGIYIGLRQFKDRRGGRLSPYRGVMLWHHYTGLVFGILTLTWLFSGLLSINPWGTFEGRSFSSEVARIRGGTMGFYQARDLINNLALDNLPSRTVRLEGGLLNGEPYLLAWRSDGTNTRLNQRTLNPNPLTEPLFRRLAARVRPDAAIRSQGWITEGDAYYYSHHDEKLFPVYRIHYEDGERIYLNRISGQLSFAVDKNRQWSRWLFLGLHRGDLSALIRSRPLWDLILLPLLAGVTLGALTGTWMGLRRLLR